jgi:sec-independent protein translocase protein TatA
MKLDALIEGSRMASPLQILGTEWIWVILVVAVLLFGSKKVPEVARALGKAIGEFQRGRAEIERELRLVEQEVKEVSQLATKPAATHPTTTPPGSAIPSPPATARARLEKAARDLGINPTGLNDEQLREAIRNALARMAEDTPKA